MRELVSKVKAGCMSVCFHMAFKGQNKNEIDWWGGEFYRSWTCFKEDLRLLDGS